LISFYPLIGRFKIGLGGLEWEKSPSIFDRAKNRQKEAFEK
jgi:hypothetical protein